MNICWNVGIFGCVNNNISKYPNQTKKQRMGTMLAAETPMIIQYPVSSVYKTLNGQHKHSKALSITWFGFPLFFKLTIAKYMFCYIIHTILLCLHAYSTYRITNALYNRIKSFNFYHKVSFGIFNILYFNLSHWRHEPSVSRMYMNW